MRSALRYSQVAGCLMRASIAWSGTGEISTDNNCHMCTSCYIIHPKNSACDNFLTHKHNAKGSEHTKAVKLQYFCILLYLIKTKR